MGQTSERDAADVLDQLRAEWIAHGTSTEPADRERAEWAVRSAIEATGQKTHSMLFIWVQSPMAGVLASSYVGFALAGAVKPAMAAPLEAALASRVAGTKKLRRDVDDTVWRARKAVHAQLAKELKARGPAWEQWKHEIGNYAWDQVWQTIGDPLYSQGWEQQARASEGLFEGNLESWADAMMEGQFGAGAMAQLDALNLLADVDVAPFDGIRRLATYCGWWWPYGVGAVLCERPARFERSGQHVTIEFRDGWTVQT